MKKKAVDFFSISDRWKRIADNSGSNTIAVLRQESGLIKFLQVEAWNNWSEKQFRDMDSNIISLHCFIKGNSNLMYRNFYDAKDQYGRFTTSTKAYKMKITEDAVSVMGKGDYELIDLKAASIRNVIDMATSTVIRYVESILQVKIMSMSVEYAIDQKSQLWMMWCSGAKILLRPSLEPRINLNSTDEISCNDEGDEMSATGQVDMIINRANDLKMEESILSRTKATSDGGNKKSGGEASAAGFKVVLNTSLDGKSDESSAAMAKCKGDFCALHFESVGSLVKQEDVANHAMESFFSAEERKVLKHHDKFRSMASDLGGDESKYEFVPLKSILLAREERRSNKAADTSTESWRQYPPTPRDSILFPGKEKPKEVLIINNEQVRAFLASVRFFLY